MATPNAYRDTAPAHAGHGHGTSDRRPAFFGLIVGGLVVGGVLYGVVEWTNVQFAGHAREKGPVATAGAAGGTAPGAAAPGAPTPAAGGAAGVAGAAAGTTHTVNMLGDASGYRFEPANLTVKGGDVVKFVNVSGGPHNAAFDPANVPDDVEATLAKNMPNQMAPLQGALLVNPNETYSISFAGIKAGAYEYFCAPHLAMNMKGVITVQ